MILPPVVANGMEPVVRLEIVSWEVVALVLVDRLVVRVEKVPLVARSAVVEARVEKKFVVVAEVVVELTEVKFWRVVEERVRRV